MWSDRVDELRRGGERCADRADLAHTDCTQQCGDCLIAGRPECLQAIDLRLHGTPAAKSVLPRERKLRAGELGVGVGFAELLELLLCGLPQPIKIRPRWERLRHGTPSFVGARVRVCGLKEGNGSQKPTGGFNPSRGPKVACTTELKATPRTSAASTSGGGCLHPPAAKSLRFHPAPSAPPRLTAPPR